MSQHLESCCVDGKLDCHNVGSMLCWWGVRLSQRWKSRGGGGGELRLSQRWKPCGVGVKLTVTTFEVSL